MTAAAVARTAAAGAALACGSGLGPPGAHGCDSSGNGGSGGGSGGNDGSGGGGVGQRRRRQWLGRRPEVRAAAWAAAARWAGSGGEARRSDRRRWLGLCSARSGTAARDGCSSRRRRCRQQCLHDARVWGSGAGGGRGAAGGGRAAVTDTVTAGGGRGVPGGQFFFYCRNGELLAGALGW